MATNRRLVKEGETGRMEDEPRREIDLGSLGPDEIPGKLKEVREQISKIEEVTNLKKTSEQPNISEQSPHTRITSTNLFSKIAAVMSDVQYIQRREANAGIRHAIISSSDVIAKVRPSMLNHGLLLLPGHVEHTEPRSVPTDKGVKIVIELIQRFRIQNVDNHNDYFEFSTCAGGWDSLDKGSSKAFTQAHKQAIIKLFCLNVGDESEEDWLSGQGIEAPANGGAQVIDTYQVSLLLRLCQDAEIDAEKVASVYGVSELSQLCQVDFEAAKLRLEKRIEKIVSDRSGDPA